MGPVYIISKQRRLGGKICHFSSGTNQASFRAMSSDNEIKKQGEGFTMKEGAEPDPNSVDFPTFIFSLATGAFIHLGLAPDPMTGKTEKNLELARQNIDILRMMKDKTKGNLSNDEGQMLESLLSEAQLRFVEISKRA